MKTVMVVVLLLLTSLGIVICSAEGCNRISLIFPCQIDGSLFS